MKFELKADYIELNNLLKLLHFAGSGGEAKMLITMGWVQVNGKTETRKRYKVRKGDIVEFNGKAIHIK